MGRHVHPWECGELSDGDTGAAGGAGTAAVVQIGRWGGVGRSLGTRHPVCAVGHGRRGHLRLRVCHSVVVGKVLCGAVVWAEIAVQHGHSRNPLQRQGQQHQAHKKQTHARHVDGFYRTPCFFLARMDRDCPRVCTFVENDPLVRSVGWCAFSTRKTFAAYEFPPTSLPTTRDTDSSMDMGYLAIRLITV